MNVPDPLLVFAGVTKQYDTAAATTLRDLDLELYPGEFFSLIGASGCGKTTTLKLVSGLEHPTSGSILLEGEDITRIATHRRPVHTVFQNYALFPHMTVRDNIAFGLREAKVPKDVIASKVEEITELVGLRASSSKKPAELSGGMQQRVALARALVLEPKILLLDEPLGALDLQLRHQMQVALKRIQVETGVTFLYVTHDQEEAFSMSDRIGFMHAGELVQVAEPSQMYHAPRNSLVADFVGQANLFGVRELTSDRLATEHFAVPRSAIPAADGVSESVPSVVVLRPEKLRLSRPGPDDPSDADPVIRLSGKVVDTSFKGAFTAVSALVGEQEVIADVSDPRVAATLRPGEPVDLAFDPADAWVCPDVGVEG